MRDTTERLLRAAGWSPGRSQDVSAVRSLLESRGYALSRPAELFLSEFNGITIEFTRNGYRDSMWFDAQRVSKLADPEWVEYYEDRTKQSLVPVGCSNHEHLMLMASDKGGFYGAFDDFLTALGSGPVEMIENLLNQEQEPLV